MARTGKTTEAELAVLAALAAVIILPTALVLAFGIRAITEAAGVFEAQIRNTSRQVARNLVSGATGDAQRQADAALTAAGEMAVAAATEKRLAIERLAGSGKALVILDERFRPLYPKTPITRAVFSGEQDAVLGEARRARRGENSQAAETLYRKVLESAREDRFIFARAGIDLAQLLFQTGKPGEALSLYEEVAGMPYTGGELDLSLLACFRIWEMAPLAENAETLMAACLERALHSPAAQIRFYLQRLVRAGHDAGQTAAKISSALALRAADERLARAATYLVASGGVPPSTGGEGWKWSRHEGDEGRVLAVARTVELADGAGALAVLSLDLEALAANIARQITQGADPGVSISYELDTGPALSEPEGAGGRRGDVAFSEPLPAPLEFWNLLVLAPGGDLTALADARARLLSWAMGLAGVAVLAGAVFVVGWARRRARLARLQTDFVANVTHELKTPLTAIKSLAETMQLERLTAEEKRAEFLGAIVQESDRLARLVNNVLGFSRLERGAANLHKKETDLAAVVENVAAAFKASLPPEEQVCLAVSLPEESVPAAVDSDAISSALFNLLDNAYKYSRAPRRIEMSLRESDGRAVLSVADNGVGLTPAQRRRIFRKFYRADASLAAEVQGAGLGLALVKAYAEAHGGRVDVQSKAGEGSTFTIRLPLEPAGEGP